MKTIILDTNFLLIPGNKGVDIFSEIQEIADFQYELAVIDKTQIELDNIIKNQKGKYREAALIAKQLIKTKNLNIVHSTSEKSVDDIIVSLAQENQELVIATQDKGLKKRIPGNRLIVLKQGKYLTFV